VAHCLFLTYVLRLRDNPPFLRTSSRTFFWDEASYLAPF
jgi:hypothetical protein